MNLGPRRLILYSPFMPLKSKSKNLKDVASTSGDAAVLIISPYLYLGPKSSTSSSFLTSHKITHVLSIGASPQTNLPNVIYNRLSLSDDPSSSISQVVEQANTIIDAVAGSPSGRILVHCSAAVSRSPTIIAGYLITKKDMSLKEAMGTLVRARNAVCPNPGFVVQLKTLEVEIRGVSSLNVDILPSKKSDRIAMFD